MGTKLLLALFISLFLLLILIKHNANLSYIDKIIALAKEKNVELFLLYLPSYGMPDYPEYEHYYKGRVEILKPNVAILRQKRIWSDLGHLNAKGAKEVSLTVAEQIQNMYKIKNNNIFKTMGINNATH
jgi:lysophospholipase L1-like esterase